MKKTIETIVTAIFSDIVKVHDMFSSHRGFYHLAFIPTTVLSPITRGDLHAAHMLSNLVPSPMRNLGTLSGHFPCDLSWANSLSDEVRSVARAQAFNRVLRESVGRPYLDAQGEVSNSKTESANAIVSEAIKVASQDEHHIHLTDYSLMARRIALRTGSATGDDVVVRPQVSVLCFFVCFWLLLLLSCQTCYIQVTSASVCYVYFPPIAK
jgi:hypothetical protein